MEERRASTIFENEIQVCPQCGGTPCEWDEYKDELLQCYTELLQSDASDNRSSEESNFDRNSRMRKALYKSFTYIKFGQLGKGNRIPISGCVTSKIRELYPSSREIYMGFHCK